MDRYRVTLQGDDVIVDTGALRSGPARGAQHFLAPAKGPSCIGKA